MLYAVFDSSPWSAPLIGFFTALALVLILGGAVIRWLRGFARESIKSDSERLNELHAVKKETPTMGGILIVVTFVIAGGLAGVTSVTVFCGAAFAALSLMILGGADDWIKRTTASKGLTARQKLTGQIVIGGLASMFLIPMRLPDSMDVSTFVWLSAFVVWSTFVITATSNAVNLTDGLDGLASGCTVITSIALGAGLMIGFDHGSLSEDEREASILFLTLAGSCSGFLWFNRYPAKVFMGDAGSLPIGGILAILSLASGIELTLALCGGVFVIETFSVILQVFWYRRTKTRLLLCSPLHNHFVFRGLEERRIVRLFWLAAVLFGSVGFMVMKCITLVWNS
ncbi:MAG: phospho-N-acetylmuramoyl-pentapeptide-transferase [Planctomycetota bacterium]